MGSLLLLVHATPGFTQYHLPIFSIPYSCWMFVRGGEAWYFGAPVLILVVVRNRTL